MVFSKSKTLCFILLWWVAQTDSYNVQRIDNGDTTNLEIDFYSEFDKKRFLDDFQNARNSLDPGNDANSHSVTQSPPDSLEASDTAPLDSWSVVWYIASFGGLIIFFLIVSCSEWCCRRAARRNNNNNNNNCNNSTASPAATPDTPPPSYDEFAPPSYESICLGRQGNEKSKYDIFVVPVHALGPMMEVSHHEEAPPSYLSTQSGQPHFVPALQRLDSEVT